MNGRITRAKTDAMRGVKVVAAYLIKGNPIGSVLKSEDLFNSQGMCTNRNIGLVNQHLFFGSDTQRNLLKQGGDACNNKMHILKTNT